MKTIITLNHTWILAFAIVIMGTLNAKADEMTDDDIKNAVETELLFNATTPAHMIDVEASEGIITLSGEVDNILAKDRAVKIVMTVKGVRAVVNKIEVDAPYRSNDVLEREVSDALLNDPATDSYQIEVEANNGTISLNGNVESWQEKELTEFVAKGVVGVEDIKNNIDIIYEYDRSDFEIKQEIEQGLAFDNRIDDALINVEVKNGKVKLSGIVGSANEKELAKSEAWVMGVNSIEADKLEVRGWARDEKLRKEKYVLRTDEEIRDAVLDAFLYDPRVESFEPDVKVSNGVVSLTGKVDNLKAKRAAKQDAKNVVGVLKVNNYLKVRPDFVPSDSRLASNVEQSFAQDPIIEKWEIDVSADNGIVYLNGEVDSYFEKIQAEDVASKVEGVMVIENNLDVNDENDFYYFDFYGWNTYYPPYQIDVNEYIYKPDTEIHQDIKSQLWWSPFVNEDEVGVTVENGTATLTGQVDTQREKLYAEINALEGGATSVDNNLTVDYSY